MTVYDASDVVVGSGTTDATGIIEVDIAEEGNYTVTVAKAGEATVTVILAATCTTNDVGVSLGRSLRYLVVGCGGGAPVAGATVILTHATTGRIYTWVTTASDVANAVIPVGETGTFNFSISAPRYETKTGTTSSTFCTSGISTQTLAPEAGYDCIFYGPGVHGSCAVTPAGMDAAECNYPVADTLFLTDSVYGAVTLTYSVVSSVGAWRGSKAVTIPACPSTGAPAEATTLNYTLRSAPASPGSTVVLAVTWLSGAANLTVSFGCVGDDEYCPQIGIFESNLEAIAGVNPNLADLYCTATPAIVVTE